MEIVLHFLILLILWCRDYYHLPFVDEEPRHRDSVGHVSEHWNRGSISTELKQYMILIFPACFSGAFPNLMSLRRILWLKGLTYFRVHDKNCQITFQKQWRTSTSRVWGFYLIIFNIKELKSLIRTMIRNK